MVTGSPAQPSTVYRPDKFVGAYIYDPATGRPVGAAGVAGYSATITFTPAAAVYSANDVMDVAKTISWVDRNGVAFPGGELMIISSSLQIAHTAIIAGETSYVLATYSVTPPSAHADNDAWDVPSGDRVAYKGQFSLGTPVDLGSTLQVDQDGINRAVTVAATGVTFAELITVGAFTATAVARKVTLHAVAL